MKTLFKIFILLLSFNLVCSACSSGKSKEQGTEKDEAAVIEVATVQAMQPESELSFPGELESYYGTDIFPKINSYIKTIHVDIGDRVKAGQLLVDLEAPEVESQLAESYSKMKSAEATFGATQANYKRLMQTNKTPGAVSINDIEYARAHTVSDSLQVVGASSHYEAMLKINSYLKITAPFDGIITDRQLAPGGFVGPGERSVVPILRIKNESKLRLHIAIPEKYVSQVTEGGAVNFTVKSFPKNTFHGQITRLSKSIDTKTRSEIIEILIDNADERLMPGMYATVALPSQRQEKSLFVPQSAVVINQEKCFVIRVAPGNRAQWTSVQLGNKSNGLVEVYGGLSEGEQVVKEASDEIRDGSLLNIERK